MQKQILYGIIFSCLSIAVGFAIGFYILEHMSYGKRGPIGVPLMLGICIVLGFLGGYLGARSARKEFPGDED